MGSLLLNKSVCFGSIEVFLLTNFQSKTCCLNFSITRRFTTSKLTSWKKDIAISTDLASLKSIDLLKYKMLAITNIVNNK